MIFSGMCSKLVKLAVLAVLVSSCGGGGAKDGSGGAGVIPVRVMTVESVQSSGTKAYIGTVEASKSSYLRCRYSGKLVSLNVGRGDAVSAGDVLAEIESSSVISARDMAHSALKQAEDGYARSLKLHEKGSISDVKMVEVETRLAQARASAEAADKALEDCRIKAPYSGVIDEVFVNEGEEVDILDNLMRILDVSSPEIRFPVPENELGKVSVGHAAIVSVPALDIENADAEIISKGMVASPLSHTYECSLKPSGKIEGMMPGMVVKVHLSDSGAHGVIVPASVVRTDDTGRYVWCVENGTVVKKHVVPGGFSGKGVVISEGLEDGEQVITEGVQKVCSGMKVRIVE